MRRVNLWRIFAGVSAAIVLATTLSMRVPINDPCMACKTGQLPWWACLIMGCW